MLDPYTPYEVRRFQKEGHEYYLLYYKGEKMPDQISLELKESGQSGFTTVTVTFELSNAEVATNVRPVGR